MKCSSIDIVIVKRKIQRVTCYEDIKLWNYCNIIEKEYFEWLRKQILVIYSIWSCSFLDTFMTQPPQKYYSNCLYIFYFYFWCFIYKSAYYCVQRDVLWIRLPVSPEETWPLNSIDFKILSHLQYHSSVDHAVHQGWGTCFCQWPFGCL